MGKPPEHIPPARLAALRVLADVWGGGAYANLALGRELNKHNLPDQERRFATELVYGAVKAGQALDLVLARFLNRPSGKIPPIILYIMRLAVYQLFFMEKVPPSAACNEAVKQAKKFGHAGTASLVNGVLRSAARWRQQGMPDGEALSEAIGLQHPAWLLERWTQQLGGVAARELCAVNNQPAPLGLRANTLRTSRTELARILAGEGVAARESAYAPEGLLVEHLPQLATLGSFRRGLYQVQDESSMLAAHYLDPQPGQTVLDLCAAPGGKSTHIAALMADKGEIIAADLHPHKIALIEENAKRLGITSIKACCHDAAAERAEWLGAADRVLVDVPCSGLGVLRRRPDLRWRRQPEDLGQFPPLQLGILQTAAKYVRSGGKLLYSTCTTEEAENMALVRRFLSENTLFELLPIRHPRQGTESGYLQLWPHIDGTDGFFICLMRRV